MYKAEQLQLPALKEGPCVVVIYRVDYICLVALAGCLELEQMQDGGTLYTL